MAGVTPEVGSEGVVDVRDARHPLLALRSSSVAGGASRYRSLVGKESIKKSFELTRTSRLHHQLSFDYIQRSCYETSDTAFFQIRERGWRLLFIYMFCK
jgi:hypothetical protein